MPLNEQDSLKATGEKSNCSGLTINKLFNKRPDQLQHAISESQLKFKKRFDTDTGGTVMVTCHHKRIHQKDLVITSIPIFGAAHAHPLIPPTLPQDHPLSTNQASIDWAKVQDPVFKEQRDAATLNAIHHH